MLDIFSLSVVLIRTVAFFIIASALSAIPAIWALVKQASTGVQGSDYLDIPMAVGVVGHLLLAGLLFIYAKRIARFMTRGLAGSDIHLNEPNYHSVQTIALSILGAYVLVYSIPILLKIVVIELLPADSNGSEGTFMATQKPGVPIEMIVEQVAQVALGFWLVLGSKGIASWLRSFWLKRISPNSTE